MPISSTTFPTSRRRRLALTLIAVVMASMLTQLVTLPALATPKELASGLMTHGVWKRDWTSFIDVWVPNIEWRNIEPEPGVYRFGPIQQLIDKARASGDVLRLRIYAGRMAPEWTMQQFGSLWMYDPIDGIGARVPKWWTPGYMDAYARLQAKLAAAFDGNPTVRAVTISGAMTIYAEPFIRGLQDPRTRANLLTSGYTKEKDQLAHLRAVESHRAWNDTRQILTINPWQYINPDGSFGFRVDFTKQVMDRVREVFGERGILQNNSMRSSWLTDHMPGGYDDMFAHMRQLGPPVSFQTAQTSRVGDLAMVLEWALSMGAHGVELKSGAVDQLTEEQARTFDARLEANG